MGIRQLGGALLATLLLVLGGCRLADLDTDNIKTPRWVVELLGPIATTELSINDVIQIRDFSFTYNVTPSSIDGMPTGNTIVPGFQLPIDVETGITVPEIGNIFNEVVLDSADLQLELVNTFPIGISAGTIITLRNASGGTPILEYTLDQPIGPNGDFTTIIFNLRGVTVEPELVLALKNFGTPGSGGQTVNVDEATDRLEVTFSLADFDVRSAEIRRGQEYTIEDTAAFSLDGDYIRDREVEGLFISRMTNKIPLTFQGSLVLTDANYNVLDSLVPFTTIPPAVVDDNGNVLDSTTVIDTTEVSNERYALYLNQGRYLITRSSVNTLEMVEESRRLTEDQLVRVRLVGDLVAELEEGDPIPGQ